MSINNSILKLLNMKDKNLNFNENFVVEREIKNKRCLVREHSKINVNIF